MDCTYQYAVEDHRLFIRMVGYMKYTESTGFDAFISSLSHEDISDVLIDLSDAEYLDSTNLGLIAQLGEKTLDEQHHAVTIFTPNDEITELLYSVGFDDMFMLLTDMEQELPTLSVIPNASADTMDISRMMIRAHKKLMEMNDQNHQVFREVVNLMEDDLRRM